MDKTMEQRVEELEKKVAEIEKNIQPIDENRICEMLVNKLMNSLKSL